MFAPAGLGAGHRARIGFMIKTGQVQGAVEKKNAKLVVERVTVFGGLGGGAVDGDGDVAGKIILDQRSDIGRKMGTDSPFLI